MSTAQPRALRRPLSAMALLVLVMISAGCGTRVKTAAPAGDPLDNTAASQVPAVSLGAEPVDGAAPASGEAAASTPAPSSGSPAGGSSSAAAANNPAARSSAPQGSALATQTSDGGQRTPTTSPKGAPAAGGAQPGIPQAPASPSGPKSDIIIGSLGTFSGPAGALVRDAADAVQVWTKWINQRGGLNGHRVRHILADDGADPARHRALERELVEQQKIQAFVYKFESFAGFSGPDPYIVERRIPVVGVGLGEDYVWNSPYYFPQASAGDEFAISLVGGWADAAKSKGLKRLGTLACVETPSCDYQQRLWEQHAASFGLQSVFRGRSSLTQPDYTAECLAARNNNVEVLAIGLDDKAIARVATACHRQNYRPLIATLALVARPTLPENSALDGTVVSTATFAWPAQDSPARREMHDAYARLGSNLALTGSSALGWTAAKLFETAAARLPEPPTSEGILAGLWSIKNNDLGGLTYPLSFSSNGTTPRRTCWSLVTVSEGKYVAPNGGGVRCR